MKHWSLRVADKNTGDEQGIELMAESEADAIKTAGDRGFVVASIKEGREPLPYKASFKPKPVVSPQDLLRADLAEAGVAANWLRMGWGAMLVFAAFNVVGIVLGIVLAMAPLWMNSKLGAGDAKAYGQVAIIYCLVGFISCIAIAGVLRMLAVQGKLLAHIARAQTNPKI